MVTDLHKADFLYLNSLSPLLQDCMASEMSF